jgi:tetratricopeptide (TPR) repeat protein
MGEADMEMYQGRYKEAIRVLQAAIVADEKEKASGELPDKYVALAEAHLAAGQMDPAARAAERAGQPTERDAVLLLAAGVLVDAGQEAKAQAIAARLLGKIQNQTKACARLIEGEIAVRRKRLPEAVEAFREGQKLYNSWLSHFLLGRAYLEAGHFAEALAEFETCQKRKSETTDLFLTITPTARYLPPLYYWLGRAQEGLGTTGAARTSYQEFLKLRSGADPADALVTDAKRRAGA